MRLRKPCEHYRYEGHVDVMPCPGHFADWPPGEQMSCTVRHESHCPGGEFLPEDALIIEKDDPRLLTAWMDWAGQGMLELKYFLNALAADQVGEPG